MKSVMFFSTAYKKASPIIDAGRGRLIDERIDMSSDTRNEGFTSLLNGRGKGNFGVMLKMQRIEREVIRIRMKTR